MGLRYGALTVDLETGEVWGDSAHCPVADLMESAQFLFALAPSLQHRGLWGMGKAYDDDCYVLTKSKTFKAPRPHPDPFVGGIRKPYWCVLHGPKKIESYFALVGKVKAKE